MHKSDVKTTAQALAYILDCTLATVESMAMRKSRLKSEYKRQISIAQTALDWARTMGVELSGTRGVDVLGCNSVEHWASRYEQK